VAEGCCGPHPRGPRAGAEAGGSGPLLQRNRPLALGVLALLSDSGASRRVEYLVAVRRVDLGLLLGHQQLLALVLHQDLARVGEEATFTHFAAVAGAVGIPVLIYNLPLLTGIDLSPSLVARVASECPNVVGLKDTVIPFPSYYAA
jgi:dihydrodipicolinate synthetase family protein